MNHPGAGFAGRAALITFINLVVFVLTWVIIIDALLSFIPTIDRRHPVVKLLRGITEPIYRPVRRLIPPVRLGDAALDLSPLIAYFGIRLIAYVLTTIIAA